MAATKDPKQGDLLTSAQRAALNKLAASLTPVKVDLSLRPR
jgi:hypothetical protein